MADTFKFWTHGCSVVPEYTEQYTGDRNGLYIRPTGYGAIVRQSPNTRNWFHLPIPTPTFLDDWNSYRYHAWLRMDIGNFAIVDSVNIHEASGPNNTSPRIYESGRVNWTGRSGDFDFNISDRKCQGPLVMSVRVAFQPGMDRERQVVFAGAGAHFEEKR